MVGDKGYLLKFFVFFYENGLYLLIKFCKNMKNKLFLFRDYKFLKKWGVIEFVFDILILICDLEYIRYWKLINVFIYIFVVFVVY